MPAPATVAQSATTHVQVDPNRCHPCTALWPIARGVKRSLTRMQTSTTPDAHVAQQYPGDPQNAQDVTQPVIDRGSSQGSGTQSVVDRDVVEQCIKYKPSISIAELLRSLYRPKGSTHKRVLHVFSGEANRPGSLGSAVRALGHQCVEIDTTNGDWHDLLGRQLYHAILRSIYAGEWDAVFIGTPCNTFSVARMNEGGASQVRSTARAIKAHELTPNELRVRSQSDMLVSLSVKIAVAATKMEVPWVIENPPHRGLGSSRFREKYSDHYSLFQVPAVQTLLQRSSSAHVLFDQCAFGGDYQKWTQLLYSHLLKGQLDHWCNHQCSHGFNSHQEVAIGDKSQASAAYPEAMAWALAHALLRRTANTANLTTAPRLRSGSAKPHATDSIAYAAIQSAKPAGTASMRRLLPEENHVLISEPFPQVNLPVVADWEEAPTELREQPAPRSTDQLIPRSMQEDLLRHGRDVHACYDAASRGRWKWARDHRPAPLVASEEQCFCPETPKGWSWKKRAGRDLWDAIMPSSWPDDPPDFQLNASAILAYALEHKFTDMQVISWMCNGYPGPDVPYHTVIGTPHVGALKSMEALMKCAAKDRKRGWGEYGAPLPPVWPVLCDPVNIAWRHGKARMTIDKSMQLTQLYDAYNAHIQLELEPTIEYVSPALAGRSTAILLTAGVSVKLWGFDVDAYFRKSGKQRTHWWMSGLLYWDGYGFDPRIQFGQREAPVRLGRQSTFLRFAIHQELRRIDRAYPSKIGRILEWLAIRARHAGIAGADTDCFAVLFYVMLFVDDAAGASIDDLLYDQQGEPVYILVEGKRVHQTRAHMHYDASLGMLVHFGHDESEGKGVPPQMRRTFLGVTECLLTEKLYLTSEKKETYRLECLAAKAGPTLHRAGGGVTVPYGDLNSLVHKLIHAASVHILGRQRLWHLKAALRAKTNLSSGQCILHKAALLELDWWVERLESSTEEGVPIAHRLGFPESGDPAVIDTYSDASRELKSPGSSGGGAWCIMNGTFYFIERRWTDHERMTYSINVLEYAIMNMGTFTFVQEARRLRLPVSHAREHTDNTAAEHVAERGRPQTYEMHELTQHRYQRMVRESFNTATLRITSEDNDVADGLSRGGAKLASALIMAVQAGLAVERLAIDPIENNLQAMLRGSSHPGLQ